MNKKDRDRLVVVAANVARLREELAKAEAELDKLVSKPGEAASPTPPSVASTSPQAMGGVAGTDASIVTQVLAVFDARPDTTLTADEVRAALATPDVHPQTIRSTLARLADKGRIEKGGHGQYRRLGGAEQK